MNDHRDEIIFESHRWAASQRDALSGRAFNCVWGARARLYYVGRALSEGHIE